MREAQKDDIRILEILHATEVEGLSNQRAARALGTTPGSVAGIRYRVAAESKKHPCKCRLKRNRDGGMKPRWWVNG